MKKHVQLAIGVCIAILARSSFVRADAAATTNPATTNPDPNALAGLSFSKESIAKVTAAFKSGTDADIDALLPTLHAWFAAYHVPAELWHDWIPALRAHKRFSDMADLSLTGLLGRPEPRAYHYLLPDRVDAFVALNQPADALQSAKSYYNVADTKHLPNAINYVLVALRRANPDDGAVASNFQTAQASPTAPTDPSVLHGVTIDPTIYDGALAHWRKKADTGVLADGLDYASLLLIADHGEEAEAAFKKLMPLCKKRADIVVARDGIAAALRAQDQNSVRAIEYLAQTPLPAATVTSIKQQDKNDPLP